MAISAEQKSYIDQYIREMEREKEERLDRRVARWITIFGIVGVASLFGTVLIIYQNVRDTAVAFAVGKAEEKVKTTIDERLSLNNILEMQIKAIESTIDVRATIESSNITSQENSIRTKKQLEQSSILLDEIAKSKNELVAARETIAAFQSINSASGRLAIDIIRQPGVVDEIAKKVNLPQGMVVAFNVSEKEGRCPVGWRVFEPAGGRFIVGASRNPSADINGVPLTARLSYADDPIKAVGGEEAHKLVAAELAPHKHGGQTKDGTPIEIYRVFNLPGLSLAINNVPGFGGDSTNYRQVDPRSEPELPGPRHIHSFETDEGVGLTAVPHNTMPPFVALYYCIKE